MATIERKRLTKDVFDRALEAGIMAAKDGDAVGTRQYVDKLSNHNNPPVPRSRRSQK